MDVRDLTPGERHERGRVHAAGEIGADRHVGDQLPLHRSSEATAQLLDERPLLNAVDGLGLRVEVDATGQLAVARGAHEAPRREHVHALEQRAVAVQVLEGQILGERGQRERAGSPAIGEQGLDLGAEHEALGVARDVERLRAEAVAGEKELTCLAVPDAEREDPVEPVEQALAPLLPPVDEHLAVALAAEPMSSGDQQAAQVPEVVDLAVVRDPDRLVLVGHRTTGRARQVDDREAPVCESGGPVDQHALVVRTSMRDRSRRPAERDLVDRGAVATQHPDYAAHC